MSTNTNTNSNTNSQQDFWNVTNTDLFNSPNFVSNQTSDPNSMFGTPSFLMNDGTSDANIFDNGKDPFGKSTTPSGGGDLSVDEIRNVYAQATDKNEMLRIEKEKKKARLLEEKEANEQLKALKKQHEEEMKNAIAAITESMNQEKERIIAEMNKNAKRQREKALGEVQSRLTDSFLKTKDEALDELAQEMEVLKEEALKEKEKEVRLICDEEAKVKIQEAVDEAIEKEEKIREEEREEFKNEIAKLNKLMEEKEMEFKVRLKDVEEHLALTFVKVLDTKQKELVDLTIEQRKKDELIAILETSESRANEIEKENDQLVQVIEENENQRQTMLEILNQKKETASKRERNAQTHLAKTQLEKIIDDIGGMVAEKDEIGIDVRRLEESLQVIESQLRQVSKESSLRDGRINVNHAKRKRQLDEEQDQLINKIEERRTQISRVEARLLELGALKRDKEAEIKELNATAIEEYLEMKQMLLTTLNTVGEATLNLQQQLQNNQDQDDEEEA